ncbi:MAG: NUDIX hydrolase [Proteobacteria bacterium]|nr:NUDIX hydrolase [Pseudomonadota bacterium]
MIRTTPSHRQNGAIWRPDVTVACIVPQDGKFLLVEEDVKGRRVLNQPAGHLESGESLLDAALRETREETGWDVNLTHLVGIYQWSNDDGAFLRFTFAAEPVHHDPERTLDAGIVRAIWMTHEAIAASQNLRSPMVLRGIEDFLAGKRVPLGIVVSLLS